MKKVSLVVLVALIMLALSAGSALALPSFKVSFNAQYDTTGTKLDTCNICHGSNTGYYDDFLSNGLSFTAIEKLDSDGDGADNITEIKARTFPNDPTDKPAPVATQPPVDNTTPTTDPTTTTPGGDNTNPPTNEETTPPVPPVFDIPPVLDETLTIDETLTLEMPPAAPTLNETPTLDITPTVPTSGTAADVKVWFDRIKLTRNKVHGFIIVKNTGSEEATVSLTLSDGVNTFKAKTRTIGAGSRVKLHFRYPLRDGRTDAITLTATALLEGDATPDNNTATETISTATDYKNRWILNALSKANHADDSDDDEDKKKGCGQD